MKEQKLCPTCHRSLKRDKLLISTIGFTAAVFVLTLAWTLTNIFVIVLFNLLVCLFGGGFLFSWMLWRLPYAIRYHKQTPALKAKLAGLEQEQKAKAQIEDDSLTVKILTAEDNN